MASPPRPLQRVGLQLLTRADAAFNHLYGSRWNPLYQSGAIVVALLIVLLVTGLWLIFFYRVGAPHASVARITADPWMGRWIRSVHRYASDAAVVATLVHAFRMYAQGRSWGPRALAWTTGLIMTGLIYVVGLTGFVMVWDGFGYEMAREGARLLDSLPFLSEPISRAFTGEQDLLGPFFFLNLFLHIALPLGMALVLWLHVSRVSRPVLLPPRRLALTVAGALVAVAFVWPAGIEPEGNPFHLPESIRVDALFGFWLPVVRPLSGGAALALMGAGGLALLLVPVVTRRRGELAPPPSVVDEELCTGCSQCAEDCPYGAITMFERPPGGRSELVARVDPDLCVSCGICAGSCAPMAVGPAGRTGREQLVQLRASLAVLREADEAAAAELPRGGGGGGGGGGRPRHVVVCCQRGADAWGGELEAAGARLHPVDCAGSVHSSVVELLVRSGAPGVLVLACPPRDCWNREGPRWLEERMYHDREAELQARVDRRRVRLGHAGPAEAGVALGVLRSFMADTGALDRPLEEVAVELGAECDSTTAPAPSYGPSLSATAGAMEEP